MTIRGTCLVLALYLIGSLFIDAVCKTAVGQTQPLSRGVVKVERSQSLFLFAWDFALYINGEQVGRVANGQVAEFTFTPAADGRNVAWATSINVFKEEKQGDKVSFTAYDGSVVRARVGEDKGFSGDYGIQVAVTVDTIGKVPASDLRFDGSPRARVVAHEVVRLAPGTVQRLTKTHTIDRAFSVLNRDSREKSLSGSAYGVAGELRSRIERETGHLFRDSEQVTREVELDGNVIRQARVLWVERVRSGSVKIGVAGEAREVRFEYVDGLEAQIIPFGDKEFLELEQCAGGSSIVAELDRSAAPTACDFVMDEVLNGGLREWSLQKSGDAYLLMLPDGGCTRSAMRVSLGASQTGPLSAGTLFVAESADGKAIGLAIAMRDVQTDTPVVRLGRIHRGHEVLQHSLVMLVQNEGLSERNKLRSEKGQLLEVGVAPPTLLVRPLSSEDVRP